MTTHDDDYLFTGEGEPDPEVARLERVLAPLAFRERAPTRTARPSLWRAFAGAAAAALLLLVLGVWPTGHETRGYRVTGLKGRRFVSPGHELVTETEHVTLMIGDIGEVALAPGSRVRVDDAGVTRHKLFLERGDLQATIVAPPRLFQVDTPAGLAVDLGCAYKLTVDERGRSILSVTEGQVAFEFDGREVYVPAGASCVSVPGEGPGVPLFEDAVPEFVAAVARIERAAATDMDVVFARREHDYGLTIWHLLDARHPEVRARALEWLERVFQMPSGVAREGVLADEPGQRALWMEAMKPFWRRATGSKLDFAPNRQR